MAAGDGDSSFRRHCRAAAQDFADHGCGHAVDRHAEDREGEDRLSAHRVDVGERVGRGDAAEVERVVDHRHEEVGGRDDAGLVVEPPHRRVVAGLRSDQQTGEGRRRRLLGEELAQHGRRQLAAAAAAMGERGQAKDGSVHGGQSLQRQPARRVPRSRRKARAGLKRDRASLAPNATRERVSPASKRQ